MVIWQNTTSSAGPSLSVVSEPEAIVPGGKSQFVSVVGDSTIGALQPASGLGTPTSVATPFPFLPPGSVTGLTPSLVTAPPKLPVGTGPTVNPGSASLLITSNGTCGSCTVNVQNADLFFWYPQTYEYMPYQYKQLPNGNSSGVSFTKIPNPSPFSLDVSGIGAAALETFFYTPPTSTTVYTNMLAVTGPSQFTTQTQEVAQTRLPPSEVVAPEFTAYVAAY